LETALALNVKALVEPGHISWLRLVELMSAGPARVMGLKGCGKLEVGGAGDVTVIDPAAEWTIDPTKFKSKASNTPFGGWVVKGRVKATVVGGRVVYEG
jgi:dihydroorotase